MQLHQGDTLILLSDGVEDAYENRQAMEETIRDALTLETAQDAANAILTGAQSGDAAPADDQTVLVLRLIRARRMRRLRKCINSMKCFPINRLTNIMNEHAKPANMGAKQSRK